jgi:hypothetical protein
VAGRVAQNIGILMITHSLLSFLPKEFLLRMGSGEQPMPWIHVKVGTGTDMEFLWNRLGFNYFSFAGSVRPDCPRNRERKGILWNFGSNRFQPFRYPGTYPVVNKLGQVFCLSVDVNIKKAVVPGNLSAITFH